MAYLFRASKDSSADLESTFLPALAAETADLTAASVEPASLIILDI